MIQTMFRYADDPVTEMHVAARDGDAGALDEVLSKELNSSEDIACSWESRVVGAAPVVYSDLATAKADALLLAVRYRNLDCVKVLLKFDADIEGRYCQSTGELDAQFDDDIDFSHGCTPLFIAAAFGDLEIMRLLLEKGAQVNACDKAHCTPLMIASASWYSDVNVVKLLIEREADLALQDQDGKTAIHYAVDGNSDEILSCLIENGADVNARSNDNCTPLMVGSKCNCHIDLLKLLVKHGAEIDLQDKDGNTALHHAKSGTVFFGLWDLGATLLQNNNRLTPLLLASNMGEDFFVMPLMRTLDLTKNERVDALELLGASLTTKCFSPNFHDGFHYMRLGMEERFSNPFQPLLKQPMEPVDAYQRRKESQTPEELAEIENNIDALFMESLIIKERILGKDNKLLIDSIMSVADHYTTRRDIINIGVFSSLYKHAIGIAQSSNGPAIILLRILVSVLVERAWHVPPSPSDIVEPGNLIVLEYERQEKMIGETESASSKINHEFFWFRMSDLFSSSLRLLETIAKYKLYDEVEVSLVLKKLLRRVPHLYSSNTFLHEAVVDYEVFGLETVRILLREGMNVNAVDHNGDTPLHRAVTYRPRGNKIHCLMDILQLLFDGGAHHDFVNNNGKTPMDLAETDEARIILLERRKLELRCISAKAVKKFGIPYLGVVPKILEKYINMH